MRISTINNFLLYLPFIYFCCASPQPRLNNVDEIVEKAISAHGGQKYENCIIEFDFRDMHIMIKRDHGRFSYSRKFEDDGKTKRDVLTNDGLQRFVDGHKIKLTAQDSARFASSVNSIAYFVLLPFRLNDPAVVKKFNRELLIDGEPYYEISVFFQKEGGGKDHEDEFVYWFHQEQFTMDYLAYKYNESDDGTRFRHAIRQQKTGGILLADYANYVAPGIENIQDYPALFEKGELKKVSEIVLENVSVRPYE